MTFCVGIHVREGLIALADTRIVRGAERHSKTKLAVLQHRADSFFVMTSGLRSVRDKTVIYLEETLQRDGEQYDRLYQIANLFGESLRRVKVEDGPALAASGLKFNVHAILGGRLSRDARPTLFYVYSEGNWIESAADSPYFVIGRTYYAKPLLDHLLRHDTSFSAACALAVLAFDTTRSSVTDVDFPVDILTVPTATGIAAQHRFDAAEMSHATQWWSQRLTELLGDFPMDWAAPLSIPSN